jgi:hypothetical protein
MSSSALCFMFDKAIKAFCYPILGHNCFRKVVWSFCHEAKVSALCDLCQMHAELFKVVRTRSNSNWVRDQICDNDIYESFDIGD